MMFTKYIVVVDAEVDVHNTSEVLFHLFADTDPQRDTMLTRGPSDVLDHATSEIASGSKLGIDATKKIPGEGGTTNRQVLASWQNSSLYRVERIRFTATDIAAGSRAPAG